MEAGIMVNVASWNQPEQMHFLEVHDELLDGKALFCLKLNERIFKVICLPSPSGSASRRIKSHPFFRGWLHFYNPEIFQLIEDGALIAEVAPGLTDIFRRQIYEIAINQDFETLSIFQDFP